MQTESLPGTQHGGMSVPRAVVPWTLADWKRLGRKRLGIFGIVPSVVLILDKAAKEVVTDGPAR